MPTDRELLRQYVERADETAFAEVVRRHTDLVYSVAQRVTCNGGLAEDVTQSVFIQLAQQASRLSHYDTPIGWLHTTSRRRAIDAVRGEVRRQVREQKAIAMHIDSAPPDMNWKEIAPLLDEAVNQLSDPDRDAVLLRFFKNLSHQEVGAELQLGEDAARKRVDRALEKLREHFVRRGVTASSALLTAALMENSVQAAPTGLAARVTGPSLAAVSTATGSLFLNILFMSTKTKVMVVAVALVAIAATVALNWPSAASNPATAKSDPASSAPVVALVPIKPVVAQVEKPVFAAVVPSKSPAAGTDSVAMAGNATVVSQYVAAPQADLKAAVLTAIHFLESQDVPSVLRTVMPPDELTGKTGPTGLPLTFEDYAERLSKDKADMMPNLLVTLHSIQDLTPVVSPDGQSATFILDQPLNGPKNASLDKVEFEKMDGFWYLKAWAMTAAPFPALRAPGR